MRNLLGDKPLSVTIRWAGHCIGCIYPQHCAEADCCIGTLKPQEVVNMRKSALAEKPIAQAVIEDREASHGDYTKQAATAQALKDDLKSRGWNLPDTHKESLEMICVKLSRIVNGDPNNPDHWTDIAGYATLISNLLTKGTHL